MNWLLRLLVPALAFALVLVFFSAIATTAVRDDHKATQLDIPTHEVHASAAEPPSTSPQGLLTDWRPDVDQPIDQIEGWLSEEHPQQVLNYSMANLAALYDTKLYLVFIDYLASIESHQSAVVLEEQQRWLQLRKERTAEAHLSAGDGSLSSYNASETYVYMTHERIDSLTSLMHKTTP